MTFGRFKVLIVLFSLSHAFVVQHEQTHVRRALMRRHVDWGLPPPLVNKANTLPLGQNIALGVDYGLRIVGTATSAGWASRRLFRVPHTGDDIQVARHLVKLAKSELVKTIVVGLPLHKDGSESGQSAVTREFCALLASIAGSRLKVVLVDERYSSKFADAQMQHMKKRDRDAALDEESACVILDAFFSGGESGELVPSDPAVLEDALRSDDAAATKAQHEADLAEALAKDKQKRRANSSKKAWKVDDSTQRWEAPAVFDLDVVDMDGEIARRAAALDKRPSEGE